MIVFIIQKGKLRTRKSSDLPRVMQLGRRVTSRMAALTSSPSWDMGEGTLGLMFWRG